MPEPRRVCRIGTSVSVAKYIRAPTNEARKLAANELPPTTLATQEEGTSPASTPGRPTASPTRASRQAEAA